ncbi:MAG: recombinase family protein [Acidobacteriota bacterium]|jgi:DNA invertase Pin-like site-specific DNA recombinase
MRWAGLIRVSTEKQKEQGESLQTQKTSIEAAIKAMGGNPKDIRWYGGQEHATPDWEKKEIARLLADSAKNLYDAVNVYNASRWSRDNLDNKKGLKTLKGNGKRFFTLQQEWDLYKPADTLFLGVSAEIGEYQAREQARVSIQNRIERAKRNIPTCGKLPFGRIYDGRRWDGAFVPEDKKAEGWDVDKTVVKKMQRAANRYIEGDSIEKIAPTVGMKICQLHKVLNKRCGTQWPQHFRAKDLNIDETVLTTIPPLLDDDTIAAIHKRAPLNRKFARGFGKYKYPLSHLVHCSECGFAYTGNPNHGARTYRHSHLKKHPGSKWSIPADLLENSVLIELVRTLGDQEAIQKAIEAATPNAEKEQDLHDEKAQLEKDLKEIAQREARIMEFGEHGTYTEAVVKARLDTLQRDQKDPKQARLSVVVAELKNMPDPAKINRLSKFATVVAIDNARSMNPKDIFKRSYQWKREFIEHTFTGVDSEGRPLGVYLKATDNKKQPWELQIRGVVENCLLGLPLSDTYLDEAFGLDSQFEDVTARMKEIKSSITNSASHSLKPILL